MYSEMHPSWWAEGLRTLSYKDSVMEMLTKRYPNEGLRKRGGAFETLCRSVTGQQISVKAADAIYARMTDVLQVPTPETLLYAPEDQFRAWGYSRGKIKTLKKAAEAFKAHGYKDSLPEDIETTRRFLLNIYGIGPWTVEMMLIFHSQAPDIFPVTDLGVKKAMRAYYPEHLFEQDGDFVAFSERWRPYRTGAVWLLWRALDPVPVAY